MTPGASSLAEGVIEAAYQPIVDVGNADVVGFEAVARWASTHTSVADSVTFGADSSDVDWACRTAALSGALDAGVPHELPLFVNIEPSVLGRDSPPGFAGTLDRARRGLRIVVELTERDLLACPRDLLTFVDWVRAQGWGVALDDVGVDGQSLAAMPFLDPDIVKLDMSLIHNDPSVDQARTVTAVLAHAERSGAMILAEGIETDQHLEYARTLGATLGQGFLFGQPAPLPRTFPPAASTVIRFRPPTQQTPSMWDNSATSVRSARKPVLRQLSRQLEEQARNVADPPVVLTTFQRADWFGRTAAWRYSDLAGVCRFVGVLGVGMPAVPAAGVRGADIDADDPLAAEWTVIVLGAHYAAALVARELDNPDVNDQDRRFEFVLTHDRDTVISAGRKLLTYFVDRRSGGR